MVAIQRRNLQNPFRRGPRGNLPTHMGSGGYRSAHAGSPWTRIRNIGIIVFVGSIALYSFMGNRSSSEPASKLRDLESNTKKTQVNYEGINDKKENMHHASGKTVNSGSSGSQHHKKVMDGFKEAPERNHDDFKSEPENEKRKNNARKYNRKQKTKAEQPKERRSFGDDDNTDGATKKQESEDAKKLSKKDERGAGVSDKVPKTASNSDKNDEALAGEDLAKSKQSPKETTKPPVEATKPVAETTKTPVETTKPASTEASAETTKPPLAKTAPPVQTTESSADNKNQSIAPEKGGLPVTTNNTTGKVTSLNASAPFVPKESPVIANESSRQKVTLDSTSNTTKPDVSSAPKPNVETSKAPTTANPSAANITAKTFVPENEAVEVVPVDLKDAEKKGAKADEAKAGKDDEVKKLSVQEPGDENLQPLNGAISAADAKKQKESLEEKAI